MLLVRTAAHRVATLHCTCRPSTLVSTRNFTHYVTRQLRNGSTRQEVLLSRTTTTRRHYEQRRKLSDTSSMRGGPPNLHRDDLVFSLRKPPSPASETLPAHEVTFLTEKKQTDNPATVIGWIATRELVEENGSTAANPRKSDHENPIHNEDLVPNPEFIHLLHGVIRATLEEGADQDLVADAIRTVDGWMHIHDQRNIPALNRIGNPDDIIGSVFVESSKIIPETYQPMPAYRLLTADGFMQLTPDLDKKLREALSDRAEVKRAIKRGGSGWV